MAISRERGHEDDPGRLDVFVAVLCIIVAFLLVPMYLLFSSLFILGIPAAIGIGSFLYLSTRTGITGTRTDSLPLWATQLLAGATLLGMAGMVLLAAVQGARTPEFYNVAIIVAVLLLYQIFFTEREAFNLGLILGQVLAFALVIRFAALYTTTGYVGIDIWTHVPNWTAIIVDTGSIEHMAEHKYYASPLYHLLVSTTATVLGLPLDLALYLSVGIVVPVSILLLYPMARLFVGRRWSVMAVALVAMFGYAVEWSIHLIPTSLGLAFFTASFYLLVRMLYLGAESRQYLLAWFVSVAIVLTHQIATFILLVVLASALVAYVLLSRSNIADIGPTFSMETDRRIPLNISGLFVFDLGFVTFMWSLTPYQGGNFLETMFIFFQDTFEESEGFGDLAGDRAPEEAARAGPSQLQQLMDIVDVTAILLLVLLAVIGGLYALRRHRRSHATMMTSVAIGIMSIFVFVFPMFGIRSFVPTRWYAFLALPLVLLAAIGLAHFSTRQTAVFVVIVLVVLAMVFPVVALTTTYGMQDSPRFDGEQPRYTYTESELAAVEAVGTYFPTAGQPPAEDDPVVRTDHPYQTVFERTGAHASSTLHLTNETFEGNDIIVHRSYQEDGAATFRDEFGLAVQPSITKDDLCQHIRHTVYDNGDVSVCVP